MSKRLDLLSARNLILSAAAVLVLSVVGMSLSMLGPKDSGGLGRDSFGTRSGGHRALFELLETLDVPVARDWTPPRPDAESRQTLVLLDPNPWLVATSPKYVQSLLAWVEAGGRIVVSPRPMRDAFTGPVASRSDADSLHDIFDLLDVDQLVRIGKLSEDYAEQDFTSVEQSNEDGSGRWWRRPRPQPLPPRNCPVTATGSLAPLADEVRQLAVPAEGFATLRAKRKNLAGSITCTDQDGKKHLLVAAIRRGAGEIVVVADRALLTNRLIAEADNSVLAAHLLAPQRQPVVFDEFYHGLLVRGNAFYLLTRPGFAATTLGLLLVVGALAWRAAVFLGPPLNKCPPTRRDIGEYVQAMARFLSRGQGSRRFLVREVRDGVLREICRELKLPIDALHFEMVATALARRNRERARRLETVVREVDAQLAAPGDFPRTSVLPAMQRLANCL